MHNVRFGPQLTPAVKSLIIINVTVFIVQFISYFILRNAQSSAQIIDIFALWPDQILRNFYFWQIFTYQFLHSTRDIFHIVFNMFALWMFGSELEEKWGKSFFIKYYLICGTGAGFFIFLIPILLNQPTPPTIGASGAIFGILLAYAIYWPDRHLLFMFLIPVKVKYFVLIIGLVSLFFTFQSTPGAWGVSHVGHLGGLLTGYFYILYQMQKKTNSFESKVKKWNLIERYKLAKKKKEWLKKEQEKYDMMHMEEKIDTILEKISQKGMKSLTNYEKSFLKKASENLNEKEKKKVNDKTQIKH
ncbi:MAG: rhomboid family intramembrane serine protease [Spirochaetia bacterium]|nr:rhomboid family intramembrane serine protease [Spirochaetia bacterium]